MMVAFISPKKTLCVIIKAIINGSAGYWFIKEATNQWRIMSCGEDDLAQQNLGGEEGRDRKRESSTETMTLTQGLN